MIRKLKFVIPTLVVAALGALSYGADQQASVGGVVKNQLGEPAVGAFVRVKNDARRLSVTVVSQDLGRYTVSDLPEGEYTVQSVGGGLRSDVATVELDGSHGITANLVLTSPIAFTGNVSIEDVATVMPEGEGKDIIRGECTHCHMNGLQEIAVQRKSTEDWSDIITLMENHPFGHSNSLEIQPTKRKVVLDYLAKNFGPDLAPFDQGKLPKDWVTGAAAKSVVTEYFLPAGAKPHDMSVDSKGICWLGESQTGILGRYDPATATYTRIRLPDENTWPEPVAVDAKDRVWIGDGHGAVNSRLIEYDPATKTFTTYPIPKKYNLANYDLQMIRFQPDGTVWGAMHYGRIIVSVDPGSKEVSEYTVPPNMLYGLAIDGGHNVWFSEQMVGKMAKVDSSGGNFKEIDLPTKDSMPQRLATDADGNLWVPEYRSGKIAKIDYRTLKVTEYPTPNKNSGPYTIDEDKARNLIWVNEMMAAQFARFDPRTKIFVEYPLPTPLSSVRSIELDPNRPNRIWFSGLIKDNIGYMDVTD